MQTQAGPNASAKNRATAKAVGLATFEAGGQNACERVKIGGEHDLALQLMFNASVCGRASQKDLIKESLNLATAVEGHRLLYGSPQASIMQRLADVLPRPGVWVMRSPASSKVLHDELLPGVVLC